MDTSLTIEKLLDAKEGEHFQFKEAKRRFDFEDAAKCCCALANCGGGKLVFGITDQRPRSIVGSLAFEQPERTRKRLIDELHIMIDFQILYLKPQQNTPTSTGGEMNAGICLYIL